MLKAKVENLGVDPTGGQVIVLLRIENGQLLPIWIGPLEAQFIAVAMSGEQPPRPLTPDLTLSPAAFFDTPLPTLTIGNSRCRPATSTG